MTSEKYLSLPVVLLDMDDTILDFHRAEAAAIEKTFRQLDIEPTRQIIERYSEINRERWELLERKLITREEVLRGRFSILFDELELSRDPMRAQELYERLLGVGHYFMPGAEAMLEALYGKYRLFICSNGTASVQAGRIESAGIAHYFEKIFVSEKIGCDKPGTEYFDACFREIPGLERDRTIIIGDSLTSDILGGINAGIITCRYNPRGRAGREDIVPDHEIRELGEAPLLLERIFSAARR